MKKEKRMFDYFEINEAKELSEKDYKILKKIYKEKKGVMTERNKKDNMIKSEKKRR